MTLFQYEFYNTQGRKKRGLIDADSELDAKEKLKKLKLILISLSSYQQTKKNKINPSFVISFTKELAQLLRAGLPLYEALIALEEKYKGHKAHIFLLDISDQVKNGIKLSEALASYFPYFDKIYLSMIQAGEESGVLEEVLKQLSISLTRSQKLKKQLFNAMAYPLFLGGFCLVIITALFLFLIPSMKDLFEGRQLQMTTRVVLSLSNFLQEHKLLVFSTIGLTVLSLIYLLRHPFVKKLFLEIALKLPLFKTLILQTVLSRFCRSLALLLSNGIPFLQALKLSKDVMRHPSFERTITEAEKKVMEGSKFSDQLKNYSLIPPLVTRMLALAETTGQSSTMLLNIAEIYEEELEKSLHQLSQLIQPIMLLCLGLIVALVMLAVLLPLTDVSSFTSN